MSLKYFMLLSIALLNTLWVAYCFFPLTLGYEVTYGEPNIPLAIGEFSLIIICLLFVLWAFYQGTKGKRI